MTADPALLALSGSITPGQSSASNDLYGNAHLGNVVIDGSGLFGSGLSGVNDMTAEQAVYAFEHLDPQRRAGLQIALWQAGFYGRSVAVSDLGLGSRYVKTDDLAAFVKFLTSAATSGQRVDPATKQALDPTSAAYSSGVLTTPPLLDYLTSVAGLGQQLGGAAAQGYVAGQQQTAKPDLRAITTTDPAGIRAALRASYQATLGRNPTAEQESSFVAGFTAAQRHAQTTPYAIGDSQAAYYAGAYSTDPVTGMPVQPVADQKPRPAGRTAADETAGGGTPEPVIPTADPVTTQVDAFLHSIMGSESGGNPTAQNPHASASGLFGYIDSTCNGFGGYRHAREAPAEVQWAKARQDVTAKLGAYGGDWRKVAMAWYLPAAVNNPALANSIPAPEAGNRLTPNQYADLIIGRMSRAAGPVTFTPGSGTVPGATGGTQPVYYDVSSPDLGARAVEEAMRADPAAYGAHSAASVVSDFLNIVSGQF